MALGRVNAAFLEECTVSCFQQAASRVSVPARGLALAAVGSFGRGAVALRSDADVMVVVDPRVVDAKRAEAFAEALLYPMWDATLSVGHQVLSTADALPLAQKDLATATALLDLRLLAGDDALVRDLLVRAGEGLFAEQELAAFIERLEGEVASRQARFGGSVYLLEPDVKSGAGGLRDIDCIRWAARARYRVGDAGPQDTWAELVRLGVIVAREAHEIGAAEEHLWRVRNRLHARAGRKADRLGFEEQEAIAMAMGYGDDRARAAERLMQDYYLHARAVTRARESLFERLRPPRRRGKVVTSDLGSRGACLRRPGHRREHRAAVDRSGPRAARLRGVCSPGGPGAAVRARRGGPRGRRSSVVRATARQSRGRVRLHRSGVHGAGDTNAHAGPSWPSCTTWACCWRWCRSFSPSRAGCTTTSTTSTRSTFTRWPPSTGCDSSPAASSRRSSRSRRASRPRSRGPVPCSSRRCCTTSARAGRTPRARARTTRRRARISAGRSCRAWACRRKTSTRPASSSTTTSSCTTWPRGATSTIRRPSRSSAGACGGRRVCTTCTS